MVVYGKCLLAGLTVYITVFRLFSHFKIRPKKSLKNKFELINHEFFMKTNSFTSCMTKSLKSLRTNMDLCGFYFESHLWRRKINMSAFLLGERKKKKLGKLLVFKKVWWLISSYFFCINLCYWELVSGRECYQVLVKYSLCYWVLVSVSEF